MESTGKRLILLASMAAFIIIPLANSQPENEAYYSTDIDDAVAHAKRNPVNKRYVGSTWYNRSTSKSFPLPKMLNTEMDEEVIEGAVGATAAGDERAAEINPSVVQVDLGRAVDSDSFDEATPVQTAITTPQKVERSETEVYIPKTTYTGQGFSGTATEIRSNVSVNAISRP